MKTFLESAASSSVGTLVKLLFIAAIFIAALLIVVILIASLPVSYTHLTLPTILLV